MKFLYIAQEPRAARLAAAALGRIAPDVSLTWNQSPGTAVGWISDNPDAAGVILDSGLETLACEILLEQVRTLGIDVPIAIVAPEHLVSFSTALKDKLDAAVDVERLRGDALETQLKEAEQAHRQSQERAQTQHEEALARTSRICTALQERLLELEATVRGADERHLAQTAAAELLGRRQAELTAALAEAIAARINLEARVVAAGIAQEKAETRHASELSSLNDRLAEREAKHETSAKRSAAICTALQERLIELEAAIRTARDRQAEAAAAADRLAARETELNEALERAAVVKTTLEERLEAAEMASEYAAQNHATELASMNNRLAKSRDEHDTASEHWLQCERQLRSSLADAVVTRTALEARLREADERAAAAAAAAADRQAALEERIELGGREIARLQRESDLLRRQLEALGARAATLRQHAVRVPVLQVQLERSLKENRRQFEGAPYGLCECTRGGSITRVNHTLARLFGYRNTAELQQRDIPAAVFESPGDLRWLIARVTETRELATVETTCKTRNGRQLFVRLHAHAHDGSVMVAFEDLTRLYASEQRLQQAQRLEAVGRVASEVAVTCDSLLREVSQGGQQWLSGFETDTRLRQQGELLLGDVTRAAGFLRQFVVYGRNQFSSLAPVSMRSVLRDMQRVLTRVLGDDIQLVLPKGGDRFDVDVDSGRVERILVHVANYARQRMPRGGRVRIQLAATVVDRQFLSSHPRVRPGAHVLVTIKGTQGAVWPSVPVQLPIARPGHPEIVRTSLDKPGLDLGPLASLLGDVGGHLWVAVEPAGNITVQIHLPKRSQDLVVKPAMAGAWVERGRQLTRWFRH